jgi:formylglycine-generating enzyme required for sulfatase activity
LQDKKLNYEKDIRLINISICMIKLFILLVFTVVFCKKQPEAEIFDVNGVKFKMIKVESGTFYMGAQNSDPNDINYDPDANWVGDFYDESPVHSVTLTNNYYLGEVEVTQALWEAVTGSLPSAVIGSPYGDRGDNYPVYGLQWSDIVGTNTSPIGYTINEVTYYQNGFCYKLSQLIGDGRQFRLPTEAEWEYAARGGNAVNHQTSFAPVNIDDVAWYVENSRSKTHEVATKQANALGIYDMLGNVTEYCSDLWRYYTDWDETNPIGLTDRGQLGLLRGGDCVSTSEFCRVSARAVTNNYTSFSFRLAMSVEQGCDICK